MSAEITGPTSTPMDHRMFEDVLKEYHVRLADETRHVDELPPGEMFTRRDEFLLPVGPDVGAFLNALVKGAGARHILEIGASYGYSALWLAAAAEATDGLVTSLELDPAKVEYARERLTRAGLEHRVRFLVGDAVATLDSLEGRWDVVLLDLWKDLYIPCFDRVFPRLNAGGFIVADNMLQPTSAIPRANEYRRHVGACAAATSMLLPIGQGIELTKKH